MIDDFVRTRRNRDAWAAIRGYVYQLDLTILRWLELQDDEELQLECGEDIDLITPDLAATCGFTRLLEQVKCIDGQITLRSPHATVVLASFFLHLESNPRSGLRFLFTTTAVPASETPAAPLLFAPGILLWERLRRQGAAMNLEEATSLGMFLRSLSLPSSVPEPVWQRFRAFAQTTEFRSFIERFEWSTGATGAGDLEVAVQDLLREKGHSPDKADAALKHARLLNYVARRLACKPSQEPRTLTTSYLRLCLSASQESDSHLLNEVREVRASLGQEFQAVHEGLAGIKSDTEQIKGLMTALAIKPIPSLRPVVDLPAALHSFSLATNELLTWPQETQGIWIERSELNQLWDAIASNESSITVLLGVAGCGKSALLARLGCRLRDDKVALLALKTEKLPNTIATVEDLGRHILRSDHSTLAAALCEIAASEPVVLLIGQLDALGELMDQRAERLGAVLTLVRQLKGVRNVHIIISCRRFEFEFNTQLSTLQASRLELPDPVWDGVKTLIESAGISTAAWPPETREMLRNPQHLKIFLQNFASDPNAPLFTSYEAMLDAMFRQRVVSLGRPRMVKACEAVAAEMSDTEYLIVARDAYDVDYPGEVERLANAGILRIDERKIGFTHQTLFDYARTRSFCSGTQSLSLHVLERQNALFVRSILWSALHSLRSTSRARYKAEFETLWHRPDLRLHVRLLLITFLGQLPDPTDDEALILVPGLDEAALKPKVLAAVAGSAGWFARLKSRLPALMDGSDEICLWQITFILQSAWKFNGPSVLKLLNAHWMRSGREGYILQTLRGLSEWNTSTVDLLEQVLARWPVNASYVVDLADAASKSVPALAPRIVASAIRHSIERARTSQAPDELPIATEAGTDLQEAMPARLVEHALTGPIPNVLDTTDWYGLEKIVPAHPMAFIEHLWPLFLVVAKSLRERTGNRQYARSAIWIHDEFLTGRNNHIIRALKHAVELLAQCEATAFLAFAAENTRSRLMLVHRILACGFAALAESRPGDSLEYLLADERRFSLGSYEDEHAEACLLIGAVASKATPEERLRLEAAIWNWNRYSAQPDDDAKGRRNIRKANRVHRLRLLRALPDQFVSPKMRNFRSEEERALSDTPYWDRLRARGGWVKSPVSAEQMARASDNEIVNLFRKLCKRTRSRDDLHRHRGGVHEASTAFAEFAKKEVDRSLGIMRRFTPGTEEEMPAARAISAISSLETTDARAILALIDELVIAGFSSREFKQDVSLALRYVAYRLKGLDDDVCALLVRWVEPVAQMPHETDDAQVADRQDSLLWPSRGFRMIPGGNYSFLVAIIDGYARRPVPAFDSLLSLLEQHLNISESPAVWQSVLYELRYFQGCNDPQRYSEFLTDLFDRYPPSLPSHEGIQFLRWTHRFLPQTFVHHCLHLIESSSWNLRYQALGEFYALRHATIPEDHVSREAVTRALAGSDSEHEQTALGIAFAAVHLWTDAACRDTAHSVLMRVIPSRAAGIPEAVMHIFATAQPFAPDCRTSELLDAIIANPDLIRVGGPSYLIDRLKDLLGDSFNPSQIAEVARTVLNATGSEIADIRSGWALCAGDLIQIALTLQRHNPTRSAGLELFERLMELGAYEAEKVLREMDRRII